MAKYFIITGEKSGDNLGADLMQHIQSLDANAQFQYWGGDAMIQVADGLQKHIQETAIMGFVEVVKNLGTIRRFFKECKSQIQSFQPDVVIFIDYPGFNLRMLKWAKQQGFKTVYYVAPKVWAWKESRVQILKKYADELLVILPFEVAYFKQHGINAHFVGHPLAKKIKDFKPDDSFMRKHHITKPILAIIPGSRRQELSKILPTMLEGVKSFQDQYEIVVSGMSRLDKSLYPKGVKVVYDDMYNILAHADKALVTSGTATLETALFGVPQVVCYKTNPITYQIAKRLVKVKYISLVNLILDKECVTELIQEDCNALRIREELEQINNNTLLQNNYQQLIQMSIVDPEKIKEIVKKTVIIH